MITLASFGRRTVPASRRLQTRRRLEVETLECRQLLSTRRPCRRPPYRPRLLRALVRATCQPPTFQHQDLPGRLRGQHDLHPRQREWREPGLEILWVCVPRGRHQPAHHERERIASTGTGLYILADTNWYNSGDSQAYQVFHYTGSGTNGAGRPSPAPTRSPARSRRTARALPASQLWSVLWGMAIHRLGHQLGGRHRALHLRNSVDLDRHRGLHDRHHGRVGGVSAYNNSGTSWSVVVAEQHGHLPDRLDRQGALPLANSGGGNQILEYTGTGTNWTTIAGTGFDIAGRIAGSGSDLFMLGNTAGSRSCNTTGRAPTGQA